MLIVIVYLLTLAPTVFTLDSAEFATAAYTLGIVHSPGYVVYLMIAKGMTLIPVGDVAYRVNLLSALFSMLTYMTLFPLLTRFTERPIIACASSLTLLFSYYAWSVSVVAEVYTMQMWLFALLLLLLLRWREEGRTSQLYLLAFTAGLTAANNMTTVLWWPGLVWFLFYIEKRTTEQGANKRARLTLSRLGGAALCGLVGLLPLLYLPLRSAAEPAFVNVGHFNQTGQFIPLDLTTLSGLKWYLTGQEFDSYFFGYSFGGFLRESGRFFYQLTAAFIGIGLPLGVWGQTILWHKNRPIFIWLWLMILPHLIFFINYDVVDKAIMFLPVYLVWTLFMAVGINQFVDIWGGDEQNRPAPSSSTPRTAWYVLILPSLLLLFNWSLVDASESTSFATHGKEILLVAEENGLVLARWGEAAVLNYYQVVDGARPDLTVVNAPLITQPERFALVETMLASGRPIYATYADENLLTQFEFHPNLFGYTVDQRN